MQDLQGKPIFFAGAETESAMRRMYFDAIMGKNPIKEGVPYAEDLYYKILKETIEDEKPQIDIFLSGDYKRLKQSEENEQFVYALMDISNDIQDDKLNTYGKEEILAAMKNVTMIDRLYQQSKTPLKNHVTDPEKLLAECNELLIKLDRIKSEQR